MYPLDLLKLAGVDMTSPAAVETTFAVLAGYVDKLEELISITIWIFLLRRCVVL